MAFKFEKGMYQQAQKLGLTMTQLLEKENPSQREGLDAFEFALFEQQINLKHDTVERFYRTNDDAVLFPEFINRNVRIGIEGLSAQDLSLADVIATTTTIDAAVYQTVNAQFSDKKLDFKKIAEGGEFPTVSISTANQSIKLAKIGVKLEATYEVLRRMKLPLFSIHMQLIGKRLAKRMVAYAIYNIINGDGNGNGAPKVTKALNYDNLLDFYLDMDNWEATVWLAKKVVLKEMLKLAEFKDSRLFDTARTGTLATPFGNEVKKFNWTETTLADNQLIQLDKSASLEMIKETGAELIETDKVIDKQLEKTVISQVVGFSRIFTDAAQIFEKA